MLYIICYYILYIIWLTLSECLSNKHEETFTYLNDIRILYIYKHILRISFSSPPLSALNNKISINLKMDGFVCIVFINNVFIFFRLFKKIL